MKEENIIIESNFLFEEALAGKETPDNVRENLVIIPIVHWSFDENIHQGQLVVHKNLAKEIGEIFEMLQDAKFPIAKVIPVSKYDWSDEASMEDNNTSAFNYRVIYMTNELSNHAQGCAIDINPALNPYTAPDFSIHPKGAEYRPEHPGTIVDGGVVAEAFESRGWQWGGRYKERKDWHHFEKPL